MSTENSTRDANASGQQQREVMRLRRFWHRYDPCVTWNTSGKVFGYDSLYYDSYIYHGLHCGLISLGWRTAV